MQTDLIFLKEYAAQHYKCLNPYKSLIHFYSSNIPFKMERQLVEKGKKMFLWAPLIWSAASDKFHSL